MIAVDSSVWIDYFNGTASAQTDYLDAILDREYLVIGDLILAEVLQGFRRDRDYRIARSLLLAMEPVSFVSPELALQSADYYRKLRNKGITVRKTIDCLIATWCISNNCPLLHSDQDFIPFEKHFGLQNGLLL